MDQNCNKTLTNGSHAPKYQIELDTLCEYCNYSLLGLDFAVISILIPLFITFRCDIQKAIKAFYGFETFLKLVNERNPDVAKEFLRDVEQRCGDW